MNSKKILIFGVFDGIHGGHMHFVNEAKTHGDHLVAVVARDAVVEELKGVLPKENEVERIKELLKIPEIDLVLLGDPQIGTYNVLKEVKPDVVFLGYDQEALKKDLNEKIKIGALKDIEIVIGTSHKGEELHSSILKKKK
ncbi:MAG: adenylyltransferase/cytidyltransferase family protein [Candidatus Paceibacterota bacterium]|jgi:FAD synthetase